MRGTRRFNEHDCKLQDKNRTVTRARWWGEAPTVRSSMKTHRSIEGSWQRTAFSFESSCRPAVCEALIVPPHPTYSGDPEQRESPQLLLASGVLSSALLIKTIVQLGHASAISFGRGRTRSGHRLYKCQCVKLTQRDTYRLETKSGGCLVRS